MTVNDFLSNLDTLLTGERTDAKIAAEDMAGDLLIWIEHLAWASADLDRRRTSVAGRLLALRNRRPKPKGRRLTIELPDELIDLCASDGTDPQTVLRGFIADLCGIMNWASDPRDDGYSSNGSDERDMAYAYYQRVGYPYWNKE
jgi:hypothetical protein